MNEALTPSWEDEIFQPISTDNTLLTPLVYRKFHKSVTQNRFVNDSRRVYEFVDFLSISPNRVVKYSRNIAPDTTDYTGSLIARGATILPDGTLDVSTINKGITEHTKTHGLISKKGNSNIRNAIDWMVLLAKDKTAFNHATNTFYKWKLNFITLTLCSKQFHSDAEIKKKLLQPMLNTLRQKYGVKNYLWRAESQANGNIHFHIVLDKWVPWKELRDIWNFHQNKLGYVTRFASKFKHSNPNGTDVHSLTKIKSVARYLSKYCGKNAKGITILTSQAFTGLNNFPCLLINFIPVQVNKKTKFFRQIFGKLWGLSEQLSKLKKCRMAVTDEVNKEIQHFIENFKSKIIDSDYCRTFLVGATELVSHGFKLVRDYFARHVREIIYPSPQLPLPLVV